MSSDFNITVASSLLGNVHVKPNSTHSVWGGGGAGRQSQAISQPTCTPHPPGRFSEFPTAL